MDKRLNALQKLSFDGEISEDRLSRANLNKSTFRSFVYVVNSYYARQSQYGDGSPLHYSKKEWRMILQVAHYLLSRTKDPIVALYASFFIVSGIYIQENNEDNVNINDFAHLSDFAQMFSVGYNLKPFRRLVLTESKLNEIKALSVTGPIQGSTGDRIRRFLLPMPNRPRYIGIEVANFQEVLRRYLRKTVAHLKMTL